MSAAPAAKKGGGVKILLIVLGVLVLIVGLTVGTGVYMAYRTYHKVKDAAAAAGFNADDLSKLGSAGAAGEGSVAGDNESGDTCKFLSKEEVSAAVGVTIVEAKSDSTGCHYMAKGSADSYTMGHITAMTGQKMPGAPEDAPVAADTTETTSLVNVSVQPTGGKLQLKLMKGLSGGLGLNGNASGNVEGIGDEALVIGNNALIARKGDIYINIDYGNCPCSKVQIEPLAKKLVGQL